MGFPRQKKEIQEIRQRGDTIDGQGSVALYVQQECI